MNTLPGCRKLNDDSISNNSLDILEGFQSSLRFCIFALPYLLMKSCSCQDTPLQYQFHPEATSAQ